MIQNESIEWRKQLLGWKRAGYFPDASACDVLTMLLPNRLSRLRNLVRLLKTQPPRMLWKTPLGNFWGTEADGPNLNAISREQLRGVYQKGNVTVRPGDVVLDLGAYLGDFTRLALNRGARLVVAFEPDPDVSSCFRQSFRDEISRRRVILAHSAAWNVSGTLSFSGKRGLFRVDESLTSGCTVDAVTVDSALESFSIDQVDFIKIDVEGAELQAIEGARGCIRRCSPRMAVCTYHKERDTSLIPAAVLGFNAAYSVSFNRKGEQAYFDPVEPE